MNVKQVKSQTWRTDPFASVINWQYCSHFLQPKVKGASDAPTASVPASKATKEEKPQVLLSLEVC